MLSKLGDPWLSPSWIKTLGRNFKTSNYNQSDNSDRSGDTVLHWKSIRLLPLAPRGVNHPPVSTIIFQWSKSGYEKLQLSPVIIDRHCSGYTNQPGSSFVRKPHQWQRSEHPALSDRQTSIMHAACSQVCTEDFLSKLAWVSTFPRSSLIHHPSSSHASDVDSVRACASDHRGTIEKHMQHYSVRVKRNEQNRKRPAQMHKPYFPHQAILSAIRCFPNWAVRLRTLCYIALCIRWNVCDWTCSLFCTWTPHRMQSHRTCPFRPIITRFALSGTLSGPIIP